MGDATPSDMATHAIHWISHHRYTTHASTHDSSLRVMDFLLLALLALALAFMAQGDTGQLLTR
jgi:hypothetical protein